MTYKHFLFIEHVFYENILEYNVDGQLLKISKRDCEQPLVCSEIRKQVTVRASLSVTCELCALQRSSLVLQSSFS